MERLKRLDQEVKNFQLDWERINPYLEGVNEGSLNDIHSPLSKYYQYLPAVIALKKPNQVVELGSAGGASVLMMLSYLSPRAKMYACSLVEPEGEFRFITDVYSNLTLIRGDDLNLSVWGECNLKRTDIWFIDTEHSYQQLHNELKLYNQFFKKGALVFLDDIHLNDMPQAWREIKYPKLSLEGWHHSGFGVFQV